MAWLRHQAVEKTWRAREGLRSLEHLIVYGRRGTIESCGKSHFPEQRTFSCSFCARKPERILAKTGRGDSGGGLLSRPSACHKLFSTSPRGHGFAMSGRAKEEKCVLNSAIFAALPFASHCRALLPPTFREESIFFVPEMNAENFSRGHSAGRMAQSPPLCYPQMFSSGHAAISAPAHSTRLRKRSLRCSISIVASPPLTYTSTA